MKLAKFKFIKSLKVAVLIAALRLGFSLIIRQPSNYKDSKSTYYDIKYLEGLERKLKKAVTLKKRTRKFIKKDYL